MSRHHINGKHSTKAPKVRSALEAQLPLPCIVCGKPIQPGSAFHVAHIIPASQGGTTSLANCGAAHPRCNLSDGGKLGAQHTNASRRTLKGIRAW